MASKFLFNNQLLGKATSQPVKLAGEQNIEVACSRHIQRPIQLWRVHARPAYTTFILGKLGYNLPPLPFRILAAHI